MARNAAPFTLVSSFSLRKRGGRRTVVVEEVSGEANEIENCVEHATLRRIFDLNSGEI